MTPILTGTLVGIAYGLLVGYIKYAALWKNIIKSSDKFTMGALYLRMGIGYAVNVAALFFVFITREMVPFEFAATIIATAVGLSISGRLAPIGEIISHVKEKKTS